MEHVYPICKERSIPAPPVALCSCKIKEKNFSISWNLTKKPKETHHLKEFQWGWRRGYSWCCLENSSSKVLYLDRDGQADFDNSWFPVCSEGANRHSKPEGGRGKANGMLLFWGNKQNRRLQRNSGKRIHLPGMTESISYLQWWRWCSQLFN